MAVVSMKQLLEAGVHFGHQTRRWNPKMAEYIFTERNGIYIIDLQKTVRKLEEAYNFIRELSENGESVLFVGTTRRRLFCQRQMAGRYDDQLHHHPSQNRSSPSAPRDGRGRYL